MFTLDLSILFVLALISLVDGQSNARIFQSSQNWTQETFQTRFTTAPQIGPLARITNNYSKSSSLSTHSPAPPCPKARV
ncbi:hypothetical protein L596_011200 [Steinernema carpocapsae]|uniref:Uncharacterized protein n=1 Tax=Steinernema carpocapsae TaxID=34508 RepID=A0A4U5NU38_STECR|nr:hypothetical protein L596_011200 [Steinernema carpocapsae]